MIKNIVKIIKINLTKFIQIQFLAKLLLRFKYEYNYTPYDKADRVIKIVKRAQIVKRDF